MTSFGKTILLIVILIVVGIIILDYSGIQVLGINKAAQKETETSSLTSQPDKINSEYIESAQNDIKASIQKAQKDIVKEESGNLYTIQVASFRKLSRAQLLVNTLFEDDNYMAYVPKEDLNEEVRWHRVYVGKYGTKEEADSQLLLLKKEFNDSFIRLLIKDKDITL